ncbi:MAG: hypothetical protein HQL12_02995 [Candidatus Omnitrophica bacterium]|nr:hypothetical protein [Candidatus Omnitrophota bacterium]
MAGETVRVKNTISNLHNGRGAINVLEEAMYILRLFPETLFIYYIGSLPFVLGLLYFWADMSQNAYDGHHVVGAAFCLSVLFIWMKLTQVFFAENIYNRICEQVLPERSLKDYFFILSTQTAIHCTGFFIWPVSLILGLPFAWVFAFYHYSAINQGDSNDIKMIWDKSWGYANHWPKQNHILILLFFLLYIVTFINVSIALFLIPQLLKNFFDIDSVFVLSGTHFFNTTFLAITCSLTYLLVNPVIKTAYVIRYFDGNSIRFGNDIKTDLHFLKSLKPTVLMTIIIVFVTITNLWLSCPAFAVVPAGEMPDVSVEKTYQSFTAEAFTKSIDRVLSEREFAWRMPRTVAPEVEKKESLNKNLQWLYKQIEKMRPAMEKMVNKFKKWLKKLFFQNQSNESPNSKWKPLKMTKMLYILIFSMIAILGAVFIVIWKMKRRKKIIEIEKPTGLPDITSDTVKADDLLAEEWLNMANNLLSQGDLRHAVRAFYLGTLSHLAKAQIITIKRYKSNYDYEIEIKRHARDKRQLCGIFSQTILFLNSVWYGNKSLETQDVLEFSRQQKKIIELANA